MNSLPVSNKEEPLSSKPEDFLVLLPLEMPLSNTLEIGSPEPMDNGNLWLFLLKETLMEFLKDLFTLSPSLAIMDHMNSLKDSL